MPVGNVLIIINNIGDAEIGYILPNCQCQIKVCMHVDCACDTCSLILNARNGILLLN